MEYNKLLELLSEESKYAKENYVPIIRDKSAEFLYKFVKDHQIHDVLEIGTAIGFSGSIILSAGAKHLTTIDINKTYFDLAKNTFKKLNLDNLVTMYLSDAKDVIKELLNKKCKFDMVFLDGAKGQYINYLPILKELLNDGGVIFADNVLLHGMVESKEKIPHRKRTMVNRLREYIDTVTKYPYETELIRLEDGIAITKVKGDK